MKTTIILLATLAGIGIGANQASASDGQNLSCITETADNGTTLRDCGREPTYMPMLLKKEIEDDDTPSSRVEPGRRGGEGRGGGNGGRGGNGGQGGGNGGQGGGPNN